MVIAFDFASRVFTEKTIRSSSKFAIFSALLAVILKVTDEDLKWDYLKDILPDSGVFGIFASSTSFFLVFRSMQAFNMYREGARNIHQMSGSWFASASSLMAFTRSSTANEKELMNFRSTLIRLYSLMSMLCLTELENCDDARRSKAIQFTVLDLDKLDGEILELIKSSSCKVEAVFQMIQCLIVDHIKTGVLAVPPPVLSRAFQELGNGMLKYHDTMNIPQAPPPFALKAITALLLVITTVYTPLMMAVWNPGPVAAAWTTFVQVLVFFTLNNLAGELENPFSGDMNDVDIQNIHSSMNQRLLALDKISSGLARKQVTSRISSISDSDCIMEKTRSERERIRGERKSVALNSVIVQAERKSVALNSDIDQLIPGARASIKNAHVGASQSSLEGHFDTDVVFARGPNGLSMQWPDLTPDQVTQPASFKRANSPKLNNETAETAEDCEIPQDFHGRGPCSQYVRAATPVTPRVGHLR